MKQCVKLFKWGLGLAYTTFIFYLIWFGEVWLTHYVFLLNWLGAIIFWLLGLPIIIGVFQSVASFLAIPGIYLMKGSKWFSWFLILPTLYLLWQFVKLLYAVASIGGVLQWFIAIAWFVEIAWLNIAYLYVTIGSAYEVMDQE